MAEKEKEVSKEYKVVTVATETAEQIVDESNEPVSERQLLLEIYKVLKSIERAVK